MINITTKPGSKTHIALDLWFAGMSTREIAGAVDADPANIGKWVTRARARGDSRAVLRGPATVHKRTVRELVVDYWGRGLKAREIADHPDVTVPVGSIYRIVKEARDAGDPRARLRCPPRAFQAPPRTDVFRGSEVTS